MRAVDENTPITVGELSEMSERMFGGLVKAVIDVKRQIMIVDSELHSDEEQELLGNGSEQADLWGINLYPEFFGTDDFVEFDSMINIRPTEGNRSRGVEDQSVQARIIQIVDKLVNA